MSRMRFLARVVLGLSLLFQTGWSSQDPAHALIHQLSDPDPLKVSSAAEHLRNHPSRQVMDALVLRLSMELRKPLPAPGFDTRFGPNGYIIRHCLESIAVVGDSDDLGAGTPFTRIRDLWKYEIREALDARADLWRSVSHYDALFEEAERTLRLRSKAASPIAEEGNPSSRCETLLIRTSSDLAAASENAFALQGEIVSRLPSVEEFKSLREFCESLGVRCWLFGGTASSFAHYVRWNRLREQGDSRYLDSRFDFAFESIFRANQDADLVIDGSAAQAEQLAGMLRERFPYLQGQKSAWEVRLLRGSIGDKAALLGNPDFLNQHSDSHSTGLIEITHPPGGEAPVRDLRDWEPEAGIAPQFLRDVNEGKIRYYHSDSHASTQRSLEGLNPPILSVIRFLTKAFQFELEIREEDRARLLEIIGEFDPKSVREGTYVRGWIEKNGKKLFQNATQLEKAWLELDRLGLREKLMKLGDPREVNSLAWWLSKSPLPSFPPGGGTGKTAAELGVSRVNHETSNLEAYESILSNHRGEANVFLSRDQASGERAVFGDGFYVTVGDEGYAPNDSGFVIPFLLDPVAREGSDFRRVQLPGHRGKVDFLVILNRNAIRVADETPPLGLQDYFERIQEEKKVDKGQAGYWARVRRRISNRLNHPSDAEVYDASMVVQSFNIRIRALIPLSQGDFRMLAEFAQLSRHSRHPKIVKLREDCLQALIRSYEGNRKYWVSEALRASAVQDPSINAMIHRAILRRDNHDLQYLVPYLKAVRIRDQRLQEALLDVIRDPNEKERSSYFAVLGQLEPATPEAFEALIEILRDHRGDGIEISAILALGRMGRNDPRLVSLLLPRLSNADYPLESAILDAFTQLRCSTPDVIQALLENLSSRSIQDGTLVFKALVELMPIDDEATLGALLLMMKRAQSPEELRSAFDRLWRRFSGSPRLLQALIEIAQTGRDDELRIRALSMMPQMKVRTEEMRIVLQQALQTQDPAKFRAASSGLTYFPVKERRAALMLLMDCGRYSPTDMACDWQALNRILLNWELTPRERDALERVFDSAQDFAGWKPAVQDAIAVFERR